MSFSVPSLSQLRAIARDALAGKLKIGALLPNSRARFLSDAAAGLAHLCLKYVTWVSDQIFPDKAGDEWLRGRHAKIWLGGDKAASFASGFIDATGIAGSVVPQGSRLAFGSIAYETQEMATLSGDATRIPIIALVAGVVANLDAGTELTFTVPPDGVNGTATVVSLYGGVDAESTEELRFRVLQRIRNPPMGGDAEDYVKWLLDVPGVTRAWCAPLEMGIGTVTLRFMMDNVRAKQMGFPGTEDINFMQNQIDLVRPVAVKDRFVVSPIPEPISFTIYNLQPDNASIRASIEKNLRAMIFDRAAPAHAKNGVTVPAKTIFRAWLYSTIMDTDGVESFVLDAGDFVMPSNGSLAVLGSVSYSTR